MMNIMEYKTGNNLNAACTPTVSFTKKLDALINAYPFNKFYRDLRDQMKSGRPLTTKQLQAIDTSFNQKIGKLPN